MTNTTMNAKSISALKFFRLNIRGKKIIGSKSSFDKADRGFGEAYDELMYLISAHPDFSFEETKNQKPSKKKQTYSGLNKRFMLDYIEAIGDVAALAEFKSEQKFAEDNEMHVFSFLKSWFIKKYNTKANPFSMKEAREVIITYKHKIGASYDMYVEDAADDALDEAV